MTDVQRLKPKTSSFLEDPHFSFYDIVGDINLESIKKFQKAIKWDSEGNPDCTDALLTCDTVLLKTIMRAVVNPEVACDMLRFIPREVAETEQHWFFKWQSKDCQFLGDCLTLGLPINELVCSSQYPIQLDVIIKHPSTSELLRNRALEASKQNAQDHNK